jgi:hypothetical protein
VLAFSCPGGIAGKIVFQSTARFMPTTRKSHGFKGLRVIRCTPQGRLQILTNQEFAKEQE